MYAHACTRTHARTRGHARAHTHTRRRRAHLWKTIVCGRNWAKIFALAGDAGFAARLPRWREFKALRARLDPGGLFVNDYVRRTLGLGDGAAYAILTRDRGDFALEGQSLYNEMHHFTANRADGAVLADFGPEEIEPFAEGRGTLHPGLLSGVEGDVEEAAVGGRRREGAAVQVVEEGGADGCDASGSSLAAAVEVGAVPDEEGEAAGELGGCEARLGGPAVEEAARDRERALEPGVSLQGTVVAVVEIVCEHGAPSGRGSRQHRRGAGGGARLWQPGAIAEGERAG
jgi:hypothetical protein